MRIAKALIVAEPWIGHLLAGQKTWEMRSQGASHRGWFGLIRKGSGTVVGVARLVDVGASLSQQQMLNTIDKHCIPREMILKGEVDRWTVPWKLADVRRLATPVPYRHKSGAVTWVDLDPRVSDAIAQQAGGSVAQAATPTQSDDAMKVDIRERGSKLYIDIEWDDGLPEAPSHQTELAELARPRSAPSYTPAAASPRHNYRTIGEVALTEGNIKHGHIYLRSFFDRFPADAVGGSNKASIAKRLLTVETSLGDRFETDLDGQKRIFRARGPIRAFLEGFQARSRETVLVEQRSPYHYRLSLKR